MGDADDGAFNHARHGVDLGLDLFRIDVEAAGDDEILAAPDDVDVAALVDLAEIAGDEEPVRAEFGGSYDFPKVETVGPRVSGELVQAGTLGVVLSMASLNDFRPISRRVN